MNHCIAKVWMQIANDEFELPLAVADSIRELAIICGVSENRISSAISKAKHGKRKRSQYIVVDVDELIDGQ